MKDRRCYYCSKLFKPQDHNQGCDVGGSYLPVVICDDCIDEMHKPAEEQDEYRLSGSDDLMRWSEKEKAYVFITTLKGRTIKQAIKDYEEMELHENQYEDEEQE